MPKLQCNVSDSFADVLDPALQKAALDKRPEQKPPKLGNLIPTALLNYWEAIGGTVDPKLRTEATEILTRKPGPRTKKPLESHDLFDERPGTWLSNVAIATGCALVTCGDKQLSLAGCHVPKTAAAKAIDDGWGVIVEAKKMSNDPAVQGVPGLRFIPPGSDLAQKATAAPAPMTLSDVGTWVSEESIFTRATIVLPDGRAVPFAAPMSAQSFLIPQATEPAADSPDPTWPEAVLVEYQKNLKEARRQAVMQSIALAQVEAYELGWTMRREIRSGKPGILLIPPRVKLTYEIAPGRTVPVTQ
jgi:hypothetical protein